MKIDTYELRQIMPVSTHTISRYPEDPKFPKVEKVGRCSYFDEGEIYQWLNTRASRPGAVQHGDKLLDINASCKLLDRSKAWMWANVTKPKKLTMVDLSPLGDSENPRVYLIERELLAEFGLLVELAAEA